MNTFANVALTSLEMRFDRVSTLVGALLLTLLLGSPTWAHEPADVGFEFDLKDSKLTFHVMMKDQHYRHWLGKDPLSINYLSDEEKASLNQAIEDFLAKAGSLSIDRVPVRPVVEWVEYQDGFQVNDFLNFVAIEGFYGVKGTPRQIDFAWKRYDTVEEWPTKRTDFVLTAQGDPITAELSPEEPGVTWHAPPPQSKQVVEEYTPQPTPTFPATSTGIMLGALLLVGMLWRRVPKGISGGIVGVSLIAAFGLLGVGRMEVPWAGVELPPEAEARFLFEGLHGNIYRAFDYEDESEIYDTLAHSVSDDLLESVYHEIFQSLILENDGGAVCEIKGVKVLDSEVIFPESSTEPRFQVRARWRVTGKVEHWGHSHWRVNSYRALYTLTSNAAEPTSDSWRISSVQIEEQTRETDPGRNPKPAKPAEEPKRESA